MLYGSQTFEVSFCTYRKVLLSLKTIRYAYIPAYMYKTLPTLRNGKNNSKLNFTKIRQAS